jgi:hypothetical protein
VPSTIPKAVATMPRKSMRAGLQTIPGKLFHVYFQVMGFETFLGRAYEQHRLALVAALLHDNTWSVFYDNPELHIGVSMRQQSRVKYSEVMVAALQKHPDIYKQVIQLLREQHANSKTDVYTMLMLT